MTPMSSCRRELGETAALWTVFRPFWAPLTDLPDIIAPQRAWLDYVTRELGYTFSSA